MKNFILIQLICLFSTFPLFSADFQTLKKDVLTVEVQPEGEWTQDYLKKFADENDIKIKFVFTPTDESWLRPGQDKADIAAHGLYDIPERKTDGASYSHSFLTVLRSLEIRKSDTKKYETIHDFVGKKVAAPKGTTAEIDLRKRAPKGVKIITVDNFSEGYSLLRKKKIEAFAVGYYVLPEYVEFPQTYHSIDIHPFDPDNPDSESLKFLVRDKSQGLLEAINEFIENNPYPLNK